MSAQTAIVPFAIFPGMEQPFGFPGSAKDDIKKYFCWHLSAREQTERHTDPVTRFVNVWKLGAPPPVCLGKSRHVLFNFTVFLY